MRAAGAVAGLMENKDLARIFSEIADILEIQEGNPFRIRSFRRAAQIIRDLSFNGAHASQEEPEKLRSISGIGEGTISNIREIAETGRNQEFEELKKEIPPSLLTLLELQNLGPKKIRLLWKNLNITTIDELEKAAREEQVRSLAGMGEKSEAKILKAIEAHRLLQGRFRLDDGIEICQGLMDDLRMRVKVKRIAAAGSVRRRRETVGDIDILVTCETPAEVINAFTEYGDVKEVLAKGDTKASVVLGRGLQADLRVLEDESFGAALQYFTGSKAHNVALRERAKRMGYKINEYGLFRLDNGEGRGSGARRALPLHGAAAILRESPAAGDLPGDGSAGRDRPDPRAPRSGDAAGAARRGAPRGPPALGAGAVAACTRRVSHPGAHSRLPTRTRHEGSVHHVRHTETVPGRRRRHVTGSSPISRRCCPCSSRPTNGR